VGVMIRLFPPHPNPLPSGERVGHSSPQQSWGVFWDILINCINRRLSWQKVKPTFDWQLHKGSLQDCSEK